MGTDKDWEKWGKQDPYFGVLSNEKYRSDKLNELSKEDFFASGSEHVKKIMSIIHSNIDANFRPRAILDFGSGVGRLVIPFSKEAKEVVGVDISRSMISEASVNCRNAGADNVSFVLSDDELSLVKGKFSVVHSFIVLQHIPWRRGRVILQSLTDRVETGGFIAVHFLTYSSAPTLKRSLVRLRYLFAPFNWLRNIIKRRPMLEPAMQLHVYDLKTITEDLKKSNFSTPFLVEEKPKENFEFGSVFLFARRE